MFLIFPGVLSQKSSRIDHRFYISHAIASKSTTQSQQSNTVSLSIKITAYREIFAPSPPTPHCQWFKLQWCEFFFLLFLNKNANVCRLTLAEIVCLLKRGEKSVEKITPNEV